VEHLVSQILDGSSGAGAYGLVLLVLLFCGLGVPLPEDVALITGGFLVYRGAAMVEPMIAVAFVGILGGDTFAFLLGRSLGNRLTRQWPVRVIVTENKRKRVERLFARYGEKIVVAARFMPGVRAVTYFFAGAAGMHYPKFILFDGLAALVSAPLFVLLGFHFGDRIEWLVGSLRRGQLNAVLVLAFLGVAWLAYRLLRRRIQSRARVEQVPKAPIIESERPY
jgi:membrane protein DedA with SNARE-associated domain